MENNAPRRTSRVKKLTVKALENLELSPKKKPKVYRIVSSSSEDDFIEAEDTEKPTILHQNEAVGGEKLFSFQTPKKRDSLFQKASQVCEEQKFIPKTPRTARNNLKKKIVKKILEEDDSSEHDFSDSGSDFVPSNEGSSETEDESGSESKSSDSSVEDLPLAIRAKKVEMPKCVIKKSSQNYKIKTDDYFSNNASSKIHTSNHTLDKLETPRLPQDQLQKLLQKLKVSGEHKSKTKVLNALNKSHFNKWLYLLHENFNILLYGFGSKMKILSQFQEEVLKDLPVIVVNGFFPSLTIKDVLDGIIVDLLGLKENPANHQEALELVEKEFSYIPETHLYLLVHNIEMLRIGKTQSIFARLAAVKNIHLIASIDHINAPLIWDHSKLSKFNFTWWDVTSFLPYLNETSFESSMMVQRSGTLALSSLRNVFLSLTSNSKGIYLILVKYQIENGKNQYYQGLAFKDLYSQSREAFLVSSDLALRAQLTEFVDHKMVRIKRSIDGTEYLMIPLVASLLQQFLNEQS